ncbi:15130_t:CDS:2, partial [Acaulospora colombiana]
MLTDSTLTERNAIRKELNDPNHSLTLRRPHVTLRPATILPSTKEPALAEVVQEYVMLRDDIDTAVDQWLHENTEASPLGTYHIITSRSPPPSPLIQ